MSRYNPYENAPPIHNAAIVWRDSCLLNDGSLFKEGQRLWTKDLFDELDRNFSQNLDEGEGSFFKKLEAQLEAGSGASKKLMAEVMWLVLLFSVNTKPQKKRENIGQIWSWSGATLQEDHPLLSDDVILGLASTGTAYNTHRWRELVYLIEVMRDFKARDSAAREQLLADPWVFAEWLHNIPDQGNRQLRHILTHLLFPESFERIASGRDKRAILAAFTGRSLKEIAALPLIERDRQLLELRKRLEIERGEEIDFYLPEIENFWRDGWRSDQGFVDWSAFDRQVARNEAEKGVSDDRRGVISVLKGSALKPHPEFGPTKKMGAVITPQSETMCLEYSNNAPNLWVGELPARVLRNAGYSLEEKPYMGEENHGRHAALSSMGLRERTAWKLGGLTGESFQECLKVLGLEVQLVLKPEVVTRWVAKFKTHFPELERFDAPDGKFDEREINYKVAFADRLIEQIENCKTPQDYIDAYTNATLKDDNLIDWRPLDQLSKNPAQEKMGLVILEFLEDSTHSPPDDEVFASFIGDLVDAWYEGDPKSADPIRQVGEAIAMLMHPDRAIFFRHTVLAELYLEAVGTRFDWKASPANQYREELRFARAVETALSARGLAPRNLLDVQSFLWVVHSYKQEGATEINTHESDAEENTVTQPLNTILYGPPGTGKTYETASRAVEICDGSAPDDRDAVMARYAELCAANRIEFVTFHQSYGYEEFVEGLRPETQPDDDEMQSAAGFRLVATDGVLKRIAQRARQRIREAPEAFRPNGQRVFKVSIGEAWDEEKDDIREACFDGGFVAIGYGENIDWSDELFRSRAEILKRLQQVTGMENATGHDATVKSVQRLRNDMRTGDIVIASKGNKKVRAIGVVTGDYYFEQGEDVEYPQRRHVDWRWVADESDEIDVSEVYGKNFAMGTLYRLVDELVNWQALGSYFVPQNAAVDAPKMPYVLIIDEINRANISKVMGEMITLLEEDKREGQANALSVVLPHSKKSFMLPSNLHILGTMNTADRSIALLDTALRRRFQFEAIDPDPSLLDDVEGVNVQRVLEVINQRLEYLIGPDHLIGHAWLMGPRDIAALDDTMANKVIPLMREYFHEDLGRVRAVLGGGDAFLQRVELTAPPGLDDDYGEKRYRYDVAPSFGAVAYRELVSGAGEEA
ncbi:hypothetical protein CSC82_21275 [Rhodobacteraceae bacterium 4F10]|nr:hypothetical protein CSC82_21275 [Rhodobacteraceae bacterium 4F10]